MAESEQRNKENCIAGSKETMVKQEKRENTLTNGGKGSGDDADSLEELPLDIGEHYLVRRSDDSWRKYINNMITIIFLSFLCLEASNVMEQLSARFFRGFTFVFILPALL